MPELNNLSPAAHPTPVTNADLATIAAAVVGGHVQTDILALPTLPSGVNPLGSTKDNGPDTGAGTMGLPVHGDMSGVLDLTAAPPAGQKWVITDIFISTVAAAEVHLEEETSGTTIFGPVFMGVNDSRQWTPRGKLKLPVADKKVRGHSSTMDHVTIQLSIVAEV